MSKFGKKSEERLATCHQDLILICNEVVKSFDISILEGSRTLKTQQKYFNSVPQRTTLDGIKNRSKHQVSQDKPKSEAVDVAPYPIDFSNHHKAIARFYLMAGYFFQAAETLYEAGNITHKIRWGGDWDSDKEFKDQSFDDLPHMELIKIKTQG